MPIHSSERTYAHHGHKLIAYMWVASKLHILRTHTHHNYTGTLYTLYWEDTIKTNKDGVLLQLLHAENRELLGIWLVWIPTGLRCKAHRLKLYWIFRTAEDRKNCIKVMNVLLELVYRFPGQTFVPLIFTCLDVQTINRQEWWEWLSYTYIQHLHLYYLCMLS